MTSPWCSTPTPSRLFIAFLAIYGFTAGTSLSCHSLAPHFIYLTESFLKGRFDLFHVPAPAYYLTQYQGRWYVPFPPLPAVLMILLALLLLTIGTRGRLHRWQKLLTVVSILMHLWGIL